MTWDGLCSTHNGAPHPDGEHAAHEGPGGIWSDAHGHCGCGNPASHEAHSCPMGVSVVLRCRCCGCGNPHQHAGQRCPYHDETEDHPLHPGRHCPEAVVEPMPMKVLVD